MVGPIAFGTAAGMAIYLLMGGTDYVQMFVLNLIAVSVAVFVLNWVWP